MKRRVVALLTALSVMAMSMTAFAAPSAGASDTTTNSNVNTGVKAETAVKYDDVKVPEGLTKGEQPAAAVVQSAASKVASLIRDLKGLGDLLKNDTLKAAATDTKYTVSAKLLTVLNLDGTPGTYEITVPGVKKGAIVFLLHEAGQGWDVIPASVPADGTVKADFPSFSNYAIVEVDLGAASPKTGEAFPAVAVMAVICLAGVVVCRRKLRFS